MSPGTAVDAFLLAAVGQGRWSHKLHDSAKWLPTNCSHQSYLEHFSMEEFFSMFILFFWLEAYLGQRRLNMLLKY